MTASSFFQDGPVLANQFTSDRMLRSLIRRKVPAAMRGEIESDLDRFGKRMADDVLELARRAEAELPRLVPYDAWGRRIDRIEVSPAWAELDRVSAEEGIVAIGYERRHGVWSRLYQMAKLYLFHPSSAYYSCPLAMTDGAARAIEVHGDEGLKKGAFRHLTTRDPKQFWTSGQWMTERTGGSDVSLTSTIARRDGDGFRLHGSKWFTSATTAQMAMTLARVEGGPEGGRGLSLFYLELRNSDGSLNGLQIRRLKDKLGTKALPTAELELEGTRARLVGGEGDGVRKIASLFNVTRVYNAVCALATMRRGLALARDYAARRVAFGKPLSRLPLHVDTLAALQAELEGCFHLVFHVAELMGRDELGQATPEESARLRGLTPIAKLFVGRQGVTFASEILEAFGGAGYVEDTGLPGLLRDAQVLSIWEGTTNVLSLDLLRAIEKEGVFPPLMNDIHQRLKAVTHPELTPFAQRIGQFATQIEAFLPAAAAAGVECLQASARRFAFAVARAMIASLLLEHGEWSLREEGDRRASLAARRFCAGEWEKSALDPSWELRGERRAEDSALGLDPDI